MELSVDVALSGVFGFRGHPTEITITRGEAIKRLSNRSNKPHSKQSQFIPGIDYIAPVERSSRFLLVRWLEGFKPAQRTIVEEEGQHFIVKRVKIMVPIHKHLIDAVLFSKGAVSDRWFFVQGDDVGDAFGRLNRYLRAVGCLNEVGISSFSGLPHQDAVVQDILGVLYFNDLYGGRIVGIKIAGKRYSIDGSRVRYSGHFDLRRSEFAEEINERVRSGEIIENITLQLSRGSVPASVRRKVPIFTIRNDLRISSRSKISDKTVWTAISLAKLLEEYRQSAFISVIEAERRILSRSLVSLEDFL